MTASKTKQNYLATIGIECHVQLKTKTKLFAAVDNDARQAPPNSLISHICLGLPGALPFLNEAAVALAMRAAFALNTTPQPYSKFDRKHYFYPDLPMGYQITQYDQPIIVGGQVGFAINGEPKTVRINRAHLEADAGKSTHQKGQDYSLVDLNRAGTPLLEIVSEPDMHSAAEAKAYARELWLLMRCADVSDCDLYYGNMRFDVNVSVSADTRVLGTRSETKNLNSFRNVERAVEFEIKRQVELLDKGQPVVQETRGWDDARAKTFSQRGKEDAHDYRYMPDPDLPPVILTEHDIEGVRAEMPVMPDLLRQKLASLKLDSSKVETLLDEPENARLVIREQDVNGDTAARDMANWLTGVVQKAVAGKALTWGAIRRQQADNATFTTVSGMVSQNLLSSTAARNVLLEAFKSNKNPQVVAEEGNLLQISNADEISEIVAKVLADNPKAAADVKGGQPKATQFLVGQVMRQSGGKANPSLAHQLIKLQLGV